MNLLPPLAEPQSLLIGLCVALGIGLLVGAERERRKDSSPSRSAAGIRTFAVAALMGAVGITLGGMELLALAVLAVGAGTLVAYYKSRSRDPGLTTEFALVLTCMLGGMAMRDGVLAAGAGVGLALILAARNRMHHFVSTVLTEPELHDILLFAAVALIALPLAPDRFLGPFDALNPRALITLVVAVMTASAAGYMGVRWLGPRHGLPLAGFASGFVSSAATIHAMGRRARQSPSLTASAVAGAVLSSIATMLQMSLVIGLVQPDLLLAMAWPLGLGGAAASLYGLVFFLQSVKDARPLEAVEAGRAFDLKASIGFAGLLGGVMVVAAGLNAWLGNAGLLLGAAVAGLADAHATAASAASLVAAGKIAGGQAMAPILLGLTTNAVTKAVLAFHAGGLRFASKIVPGLVLMVGACWFGFLLVR
ncbi:hypothetical protein DIC66_09730 [Rhodoferax lacus]|uniref:Uncharacterized protein n=1 Tax=Rhodoferax lacus TaxID=2184758 RepID=A0A3E1RFM5_9BURK|nr:MgtC/SapB family protein [Rhodoferax lacus]RFO97390.1 hypothetical protein DIC66_09730 [Rhodoferax lacus]